MGRYSGKTCRLLSMMFLTGGFFLVEIVVGYVTNSIALVADSFHMLSDVVALIVGFASIRIARWPSRNNTYGWVRSEILGALFNAVFLLALCFSILVESLKRLVTPESIEQPVLLLSVGAAGLVVNIIGLLLFHGQAHGHSHGGGDGKGENLSREESQSLFMDGDTPGETGDARDSARVERTTAMGKNGQPVIIELSTQHGHSHLISTKKGNSSSQMNMRGVFLHVLGDALGSVIVIISSLIIWFAEGSWRFYVDPAMSVAMVLIILTSTVPLLKETSLILLQTAPSSVDQDILKAELEKMDGVLGVHEFHLWQLTSNRLVLSAHITCHNVHDYMAIANRVKQFFHCVGIHSTTIQPEFVDDIATMKKSCSLKCSTTDCLKDTCCGPTTNAALKSQLAESNSSNLLPPPALVLSITTDGSRPLRDTLCPDSAAPAPDPDRETNL